MGNEGQAAPPWCQTLTEVVVHLEGDVQLHDEEHELEPGAHLLAGQRDVHGKHDVVGLDLPAHGLVEVLELLAVVGSPGHQPLGFVVVLPHVNALH